MKKLKTEKGNRESWLRGMYALVRRDLLPEAPKSIALTWGFPSRGATRRSKKTIGECWSKPSGAVKVEGGHAILVSPVITDPLKVADTLVHEMVHAALPPGTGHKGEFVRLMMRVGLEGKPTATHAGKDLTEKLKKYIRQLPAWPKGYLIPRPKDATRQMKAVCDCGRILRMSRTVAAGGPILCGICDGEFKLED